MRESYKIVRTRGGGVCAFVIPMVAAATDSAPFPIPLPKFREVIDHSPDFECGDNGSGTAQLSLAILCRALGEAHAIKAHQKFKRAVLSRLGGPDSPAFVWTATWESVCKMVEDIEALGVGGYLKRYSKYRSFSAENIGMAAFCSRSTPDRKR